MRTTRLYHSLVGSLLLLAGLLCMACREVRPDETELVIVYSSDVMNYSLPYDFLKERPSDVSLANFATYVKEKRADYGENCLVFDNGNRFLGTVPAGYFNYINPLAEPLAFRTERLIGYDAIGIGDKDLDVPVLLHSSQWERAGQSPIVCANLISSEDGEPIFQPYRIFECRGIRIAVLGLMSPNVLAWLPQEDRRDFEVEDMIESAVKWMPAIQQEQPDLIVGLFGANLKYQDHGDGLDTYKNPNGSVPTAIRVPGFDLVLMGGSAEREVFEVRNDAGQYVTCVQTGTCCTHCGEVRIELMRKADNQYQKRIFASIVDLKQYRPDPDYCNSVADVQDTLAEWLNEPLGVLSDTLFGADGFFGHDAYRQLIHRAQLWFTGADISLASCLIGTDTIMPGPVTARTLFQIFPYSNAVELVEMQGGDIVRFLEYSNGMQFETMSNQNDQLLALKRDKRGGWVYDSEGIPYLAALPRDFTSAAGIRYTVDVSKPEGERVHVISMADGKPFDMRSTYKVAINSFQGKDGGQFFSKGLGWDHATIELHSIPRPQFSVRYAIQEYIKALEGDPIRMKPDAMWHLIPEAFVSAAISRERKQPYPVW